MDLRPGRARVTASRARNRHDPDRTHAVGHLALLACVMFLAAGGPSGLAQSSTGPIISGVHLSLIDHEDAAAVTFSLDVQLDGTTVTYKTAGGITGVAGVVLEGDGPPVDSVWTYSAMIPMDTVAYTISASLTGHAPVTRSFTATPRPAADATNVRIGFIADHGSNADARNVTRALAAAEPGIVLHGGDIAYSSSGRGWDTWFAMVEPVASRVPWMPAVGNHDAYDCTGGGPAPVIFTIQRCGLAAFRVRFTLPEEPRLFHSFDWGPVHVIILDTEAYHYANSTRLSADPPTDRFEQEAFLEADLAAHASKWTLVVMHRPPYSSSTSHGSDLDVRAHLAPILGAGGADLVLTGHDHMYERTWALDDDGIVRARTNTIIAGDGTIYVVGGGGGAGLYKGFAEPAPEWSAFREAVHQYMVIDVTADRLDARAITPEGRIVDAFTIVRAVTPQGEALKDQNTPGPAILGLLGILGAARARRRFVRAQ